MLKRYKEIWFGVLLGAGFWLVDAWMHVELGSDVHSTDFFAEIFEPQPTAVLFRSVYFLMATAFGVYLWRSNWRERELRALETAIIAFQRQLDRPALRILNHTRQLQNRNSVSLDETAMHLAEEINADARLLDALAKKYLRFNEQVRNGNTAEAIKTLQEIETWTNAQNQLINS